MDEWMVGWMDGWMEGKEGLLTAIKNQPFSAYLFLAYLIKNLLRLIFPFTKV